MTEPEYLAAALEPPADYDEPDFDALDADAGDPASGVLAAGQAGEEHRWSLRDDAHAGYALRRLAYADAEAARIAAPFDDEVDRLTRARDAATARHRGEATFRRAQLIDHARRVGTRRLVLPAGEVRARRSSGLEVTDAAALAAWLAGHGLRACLKVDVKAAEVRKLLAKDKTGPLPMLADDPSGERIPGLEVEHRDNWTVTPAPLPSPP